MVFVLSRNFGVGFQKTDQIPSRIRIISRSGGEE